jgi:hypothetical protein
VSEYTAALEDDLPPGGNADLLWGGGSYEFSLLSRPIEKEIDGETRSTTVLAPVDFDEAALAAIYGDGRIAGDPLFDAGHRWFGTALSSFGIVYNRDALRLLDLNEPGTWQDLCDPAYVGWLTMVDPGMSGSVTTAFDAILQRRGWMDGWRILRRMAANAHSFAGSSTAGPLDAAAGEAAARRRFREAVLRMDAAVKAAKKKGKKRRTKDGKTPSGEAPPPWPGAAPEAAALFEPLLRAHAAAAEVTILRDYHAENILDLPDRRGAARAGLLDFQDAMVGHRAYDLVSLLHDIRRRVGPQASAACIARYLAATGQDGAAFDAAFHLLGAQRNLRILGVFARLATDHAKPRYLALLPAVWDRLQHELRHPVLAPLRGFLDRVLPAPDAALIERLRR